MATLNDVLLALGRVQATVDGLASELSEEKANAKESRTAIHRRLDDQAATLGSLSTAVALGSAADIQMREDVAAVARDVKLNHAIVLPSVQDWARMKRVGIGVAGLLALGGISAWSILLWAGDYAINAIRTWLRIG